MNEEMLSSLGSIIKGFVNHILTKGEIKGELNNSVSSEREPVNYISFSQNEKFALYIT